MPKIIYKGFRGDRGAHYTFHGVAFSPRIVYEVDDELFKILTHNTYFIAIEGSSNVKVSLPRKIDNVSVTMPAVQEDQTDKPVNKQPRQRKQAGM